MAVCYHCHAVVTVASPVARDAECQACHRDLRVCKNCQFYSPGAHWDCAESPGEPVYDKERRNFCDWFRLNNNPAKDPPNHVMDSAYREKQLRARFEALFNNEPGD